MSTQTANLHLIKPDLNDPVSPAPFNDNADVLDLTIEDLIERVTVLENLDAVKMENVTYIGLGTYGSSNANSVTFSFVPKFLFISLHQDKENTMTHIRSNTLYGDYDYHAIIPYTALVVGQGIKEGWDNNKRFYVLRGGTTNKDLLYFNLSNDNKTFSWYSATDDKWQLNSTAGTYHCIAIG